MSIARRPIRLFLATAILSASAGSAQAVQGPCEVLHVDAQDTTASASSWFGDSVALQGGVLVIGERYGGTTLPPPGSAHILERDTSTGAWTLAATLSPSAADAGDFGFSVATDGQTVVVGAKSSGYLGCTGAAYVYEHTSDGAWSETAKLVPPDGVWAFGWSCAVEQDRIVVGAKGVSAFDGGTGRVVVFQRSGVSWTQASVIKPWPSIGGDGFGHRLDLEGDRLVVGASYGWLGACVPFCEGRAFVFDRNPTSSAWVQTAMLAPADLEDWDYFGQDVALDGDRIVVGAPQHDLPQPYVGAAYVFDRVNGTWTPTAKLTPEALPMFSQFGMAVDVEGGRAVIGAQTDQGGAPDGGAAYLFEQGSKSWAEVAKFYGSELQLGDFFGFAVDLEGSEVAVGAPHIGGEPGPHGKVYLFDMDLEGPSLISDGSAVSLSAGGTQSFQLGACASHAGDFYFLAGSATGTSPGFAFGGIPVPLNLDVYFFYTLNHPGSPPLGSSFGVLDAWGKASAAFSLPAGFEPSLAGLTLDHAYAVLDPATLQLEAVSPAVPVTLVP